jgi:N-acylneuraminate cytidylyltransferase
VSGNGYTLAVIPARGGSKGVPRKNIRLLAGKPLIAYAIQTALASKLIDRVIVSTDDPEIAHIARQYGAEVPFMRPPELARDDSPEWLTWQHAIRTLEAMEGFTGVKVFVCVSPTSPLRIVEDVDVCVRTLQEGDADLVITVRSADRNPYFNMVVLNEDGYAGLVIPPEGKIYRRQDAPSVYDMTTVAYAARPQFVLKASSMFEGKVKAVVVPTERALDIDTELDFKVAEFLFGQSTMNRNEVQPGVHTRHVT